MDFEEERVEALMGVKIVSLGRCNCKELENPYRYGWNSVVLAAVANQLWHR